MKIAESCFNSSGEKCAGTLYLPDSSSRPPVVVMGHGLGALKEISHSRLCRVLCRARIGGVRLRLPPLGWQWR